MEGLFILANHSRICSGGIGPPRPAPIQRPRQSVTHRNRCFNDKAASFGKIRIWGEETLAEGRRAGGEEDEERRWNQFTFARPDADRRTDDDSEPEAKRSEDGDQHARGRAPRDRSEQHKCDAE
jgi:hypothetical protein